MSDEKGQILHLPTAESATPADRRSKAAHDLDSYGDDVAMMAAEPWVEDSERPKLRDLAAILHVIAADVRAGWPISDLLAAARLAAMPWTKPTATATAAAVQLVERVDDVDTVADIDPRDATGEPEVASPENPCRACGAIVPHEAADCSPRRPKALPCGCMTSIVNGRVKAMFCPAHLAQLGRS